MNDFKFFYKDRFKNKCRLQVGSTFIFKGYYCIVTSMRQCDFKFIQQETGLNYYMTYKDYLDTPSAAGRRLR